MTNNRYLFTNIKDTERSVEMGDGYVVQITFVGSLTDTAVVQEKTRKLAIKYVLFVEEVKINVLSLGCLRKKSLEFTF